MKKFEWYRKTFRLLEVLGALVVAFHSACLLGAGLQGTVLFLFSLNLACLAAMLLGLVSVQARRASWWALFVCGWMLSAFRPEQVDGIVLILFAAYMIYDSGILIRHRPPLTAALAGLLLVAQVLSFFLGTDFWMGLARVSVVDGLIVVLAVVFSRDVVGLGERTRPTLVLQDYALTPREIQILHLVWGGESSKEVASFLGVSDASVRVSLSRVYRKLGITHGKELLQLVFTHRIVLPVS